MRNTIIGLLAAAFLAAGAQEAEAQVRVNIPGTPIDVRIGDPHPNRYDQRNHYYNRYNPSRGFWIDNNGRARWGNGYYTGWRGNRYYRDGLVVRHRNGRNVYWVR